MPKSRGSERDLPESGRDVRTIRELLGHRDISTTMLYAHVLKKGGTPRKKDRP